MQRLIARRTSLTAVAAGADAVLFGMSIPKNSVINRIGAQIALQAQVISTMNFVHMYAVEGWILPVLDPDTPASYETIFDQLVPKDTDTTTFDLDTGTADATPFFEPGELDLSQLFDVGLKGKRIYQRRKVVSWGLRPAGYRQDNQTPFAEEWWPVDNFVLNVSRRYRVLQPSILVFSVASPSLDDKTTSHANTVAENEWFQLQFLTDTMKRAIIDTFDLTEAGAETPYAEAIAMVQTTLEPNIVEISGAQDYTGIQWDCLADAVIDMAVEGELKLGTMRAD